MNDARGHMIATSTGGSITGKGADFIIVDDPHNPTTMLSEAERTTALRHFDITLSTRLDQPKKGCIVVIMQRLHEDDLTGHLISGGGWDQLVLPAEAEVEETRNFPLSTRVHKRKPGELLWMKDLTRKCSITPRSVSALMPTPGSTSKGRRLLKAGF